MHVLRVLIMLLIALSGMIGTGLIGPNRSAVEAEYGLSHSHFGIGFAAIQIVAVGTVLLNAGRLRRFNHFNLLTMSLAVQAVGFVAVFFTRDVWSLAGGWALIVFGLTLGAVVNNISMDLWPHHPRRGVILLHSFNGGGKVVGPIIAAVCLGVGWRMSFLSVGGITLALLAAFLLSRGSAGRFCEDYAPPASAGVETNILKQPFYWMCMLPFALITGGEVAFATLLPTYFQKVRGMTGESASLLLTIHLLGLVAGRFASAYLGKKVSNNTIIGVCLAAGVFVFPAIFVDHWLVRNTSLFLMGVMFSATWPTFYAQVSPYLADHKEMLAFGSSLGTTVGISICVLLSSVIADFDLTASLIFGPAILWLFGVIYYATRLRKAPDQTAIRG